MAPPASFKPGFRDLRWGDPIPSDMVVLSSEDQITKASRPSDKLQIGTTELTKIIYKFYQDRLAIVELEAPGTYDIYNDLFRVLTAAFGETIGDLNSHSYNFWTVERDTSEETTVSVIQLPGKVAVFISSGQAKRQIEADKVAKATLAASDL